MTYQFNTNMLPDTCFHPGALKYVVPGNEGRLLDPRRTPLRVFDVKLSSGFVVFQILDFEDKGAYWEMPLECVNVCQFAQGSTEASKADVAAYTQIISQLDQPLEIPADTSCQATSAVTIASLRKDVRAWIESQSAFLTTGVQADFSGKTDNQILWAVLKNYMMKEDLWDIEAAFAEQFVRNPNSGELVKGHRIVLAELGLVAFEGKQIRKADLFDGSWNKQQRAKHILHRLAFVRELYKYLGHSFVVLYRGLSCQGQPQIRGNSSFISATFSLEVAMSHFNDRDRALTGILLRQIVPIERIFMSFLETAQMNQHYKEMEAILLHDGTNKVF